MKNKITKIQQEELNDLVSSLESEAGVYVVSLDGREISSREEYHQKVAELMRFPLGYEPHNFDAYLDWMRDLSWLHKNNFVFVINHYDDFLPNKSEEKRLIMQSFQDDILPFWEGEVETVVAGGAAMPFNVYLGLR